MKITSFTSTAIHALLYLARHPERLVKCEELALHFAVPLNNMRKVMHKLHRDGLIVTGRGRNGGSRLALQAGAISIGDVIRRNEPGLTLLPAGSEPVPFETALWSNASASAMQMLLRGFDGLSLVDLLAPRAGSPV